MTTPAHAPFALLLTLVRSYVAYLLSIPAILLQCIGILIGLMGLYAIGMAIAPGGTEAALDAVFTALGLQNFSFDGNPTSFFLKAYAALGLVLTVIDIIAHRVFGMQLKFSWKQILGALSILTLVNYGLIAVAMLLEGRFAAESLAFLIIITLGATALAVGAQHVLKK